VREDDAADVLVFFPLVLPSVRVHPTSAAPLVCVLPLGGGGEQYLVEPTGPRYPGCCSLTFGHRELLVATPTDVRLVGSPLSLPSPPLLLSTHVVTL